MFYVVAIETKLDMANEIHSTWGDTFVRDELESASPDGMSVWYLGGNSFVIRTPDTTVYIDPFFGDGDPPSFWRAIPVPMNPTDATVCEGVLVTHEHLDHMHPPSYGPLVNDLDADIFAPSSAYEDPHYQDDLQVPDANKSVVEQGSQFTIGDLTIYARASNDPDSSGSVSYVIEHESGTFFNAGDSRYTDAFHAVGDEFDIDLGSLVFGSHCRIYWSDWWVDDDESPETRYTEMYMSENDVIRSANALKLDRLVPVHYDLWKGAQADPKGLHDHAASFAYPQSIDIARVGDQIDIHQPGIQPLGILEEKEPREVQNQ